MTERSPETTSVVSPGDDLAGTLLAASKRPTAYSRAMTFDRSIGPRCNIGPYEIARRRRSAIVFTALAVLVAVALVAIDAPPLARLALFPFAAGAAVNWAQVIHRFCVAFGLFGIENFGPLGEISRVEAAQRAADRRRVVQLVLEGSLIGALATLALVALPI
jgi:hypothetical protein